MDKAISQNRRLLIFFLLFVGLFYMNPAQTNTNSQPLQLAYFIGQNEYYGPGYEQPTYVYYGYRGAAWTRWRSSDHGCLQRCMIDRFDGRVIRCQKRC